MKKRRAISVDIYRHDGMDCSNGGISSKFDEILLECDEGWIEITGDEENLCKVVTRILWGEEYKHVEPVKKATGCGWSSGGTIVDTSDGRFKRLTGVRYPLDLHDRQE